MLAWITFSLLLPVIANAANECPSPFTYYPPGWCVYVDYTPFDLPGAEARCKQMGLTTPSIHSDQDYADWKTICATTQHYWLTLDCPIQGAPYTWYDNTSTNYLGPNRELAYCTNGQGYHMHPTGFESYGMTASDLNYASASALCAYRYGETTEIPTTEVPTTEEPLPDLTTDYCSCNSKTIYLDIVFVTDVSSDMTQKSVGDATATIQSVLFGLSFGTAKFTSQVATIAYATSVEVVNDFGTIQNETNVLDFSLPYRSGKANKMAEAINQAASLISANARPFTRGVIVLMSKSFDQLDAVNIQQASEAFQDDGGVLISIDYSTGKVAGLEGIASDGYYLNYNSNPDSLPRDTLLALCDANCFCSEGLTPYDTANVRKTPQGCYHPATSAAVFNSADVNCQKEKGFIATTHDTSKDIFLQSLFPPGSKYWIGYKRVNGQFYWEDNVSSNCNWAPGYPRNNPNEDCVYAKALGFNSQCYTEQCADPMNASMKYACQLRPCDSTYDCWQ